MTGRRMKRSVFILALSWLWALPRGCLAPPRSVGTAAFTSTREAGHETKLASVTRARPRGLLPHHRDRSIGEGNYDGARLDGRVRLDDEDILSLLAAWIACEGTRAHWTSCGLQRDRRELPGPERIVLILEVALSWIVPVVMSTVLLTN